MRHKSNLGLAAARNTAIQAATGEWFAFCDDDDQWPPGFAAALLQTLERAEGEADAAVALNSLKRAACTELLPSLPTIQDLVLAGVTPPVSAQMYRTSMLQRVGGYDARVRSGVDHDLWVTLAATDNPRVAIAWDAAPIVGSDTGRVRMTTSEQRRRQGIADALEIWRPKIVSAFGEPFFLHFETSYRAYLDVKFFLLAVKSRRFIIALKNMLRPAVASWTAKRVVFGRGRKGCGLFPDFGLREGSQRKGRCPAGRRSAVSRKARRCDSTGLRLRSEEPARPDPAPRTGCRGTSNTDTRSSRTTHDQ